MIVGLLVERDTVAGSSLLIPPGIGEREGVSYTAWNRGEGGLVW